MHCLDEAWRGEVEIVTWSGLANQPLQVFDISRITAPRGSYLEALPGAVDSLI